jgi:hypothetical protein
MKEKNQQVACGNCCIILVYEGRLSVDDIIDTVVRGECRFDWIEVKNRTVSSSTATGSKPNGVVECEPQRLVDLEQYVSRCYPTYKELD